MNQYIGRLLDDRYEILEVIGTGGMAVVYKALCHRLNRLVAIKILKDEYSGDEEFLRRFRAEGEAVAMLSHPNIVQVYDVSSADNANYIVMELIDGISLKQYMEVKGVLNWKETLHFSMQIAKGLEHAHSRGIVHRDIKPHNIMVLKDGSVKVMDFGIARVMSKSNTLTKEALGSVHYISPEQAKGGYTDNRSDLYSLSVVMYEMMTGRPPFDGESPVAVAIQHINGGAPRPSSLNPNIPVGMEQIILKGMSLEPKDRYASATEMLQDMEEFRKNPAVDFHYSGSAPAGSPIVVKGIPQTYPKTTAERVAQAKNGQTGHGSDGGRPRTPARRSANTGTISQRQNTDAIRRAQLRRKEEERKRSENTRVATAAIIVCSIAALAAILTFLMAVFNGALLHQDRDLVEVPNLVGSYYSEELEEYYKDFALRFQPQQYDATFAKGQIMDQEPAPGSKVMKGTEIVITVSLGEEPVVKVMEDLTDVNVEEAKSFLTGQGFATIVRKEPSDHIGLDKVIRTDPPAGTQLTEGQTINIWVSSGPETMTMPNVVGMEREEAIKQLSQLQNIRVTEQTEASEYVDKGSVIRTDPKTGTELQPGQNVVVYISTGPEYGEMPNVVGMDSLKAQQELAKLGFRNVKTEFTESDKPKDQVVSQSVKKNTEIKFDTEILLKISEGPKQTTAPTETTGEPELTTVAVRFTVPNRSESYLLTILQDGNVIVEDATIPAGCTEYIVNLTDKGTKEYDLYVDGEKYLTQRVTFNGNK